MNLRALSLLALATLAGCSAAPDETDETGKSAQGLTPLPPPTIPTIITPTLPPLTPPEWATKVCPNTGQPAKRFFVRVKPAYIACPAIGPTTGQWIGNNVFEPNSGYCSYRWSNTATPSYSALEAITGAYPNLDPLADDAMPGIIPDCMSTQSRCILPAGHSGWFPSPDPRDPYNGKCAGGGSYTAPVTIVPAKGINPCGACGFTFGSWTKVVIPYEWVSSTVTVVPWSQSRFVPAGQQVFWAWNDGRWPYLSVAQDSNVQRVFVFPLL